MTVERAMLVGELRRSRVEFGSDEGLVVLLLQDGQRRTTTTIPPKSVPLVRRLAALNRELDWEFPE